MKKTVVTIIVSAIVGSILSISAICMLFNLDGKNLISLARMIGTMNFIESHYVQEVDKNVLIDGAISGMVDALDDPHSVYLDSQLYSRLRSETTGSFGGIGVYMGFKEGGVYVLSVMPDSPGERVGLMAGDSILAVNSQPVSEIDPTEVALKIRGEVGSVVELLIRREGQEDKTYSITREIIQVETVFGRMIDDRMGYIRISNFSENTGVEFKTVLEKLSEQNMQGFILDLRQNPGGLITSCVEVAREIVPKGPIVSVVKRNGETETYNSELEQAKYPIIVLLDEHSASASELLSGALQDTKAALIVGTTSYGKGSVQTVIPMFRDDGLKLTIAKYYTPNGRSIDGTGITPDIEVKLEHPILITREPKTDSAEDLQLQKAEEILNQQIKAGKILFENAN